MKSALITRLKDMGMEPKRSLGQNFLVSESAVHKILNSLPKDLNTPVVEIGPGPGALTEGILERGFTPTLIELDHKAAAYWRGRGLTVLEEDALGVHFDQFSEDSFLISNLPYQISASLVLELSIHTEAFSEMTLTFQKEVAQRISSEPKNSSYGLLSVISQTFWKVSKVMDLSPQAFFPAPKVASRVLQWKRKEPPVEKTERAPFLRFVKACFHQKRKTLANNLKSILPQEGAAEVLHHLSQQGLGGQVRAEELSPQLFLEIFRIVRQESSS